MQLSSASFSYGRERKRVHRVVPDLWVILQELVEDRPHLLNIHACYASREGFELVPIVWCTEQGSHEHAVNHAHSVAALPAVIEVHVLLARRKSILDVHDLRASGQRNKKKEKGGERLFTHRAS